MYIKKYEMVKISLENERQIKLWHKSAGINIIKGEPFEIHWSLLITKKEERKLFIKVECDDCKNIFDRRIRDLKPDINYHLCRKCIHKGERGPSFGKPINNGLKDACAKMNMEGNNPFSRNLIKEKLKEKQKETTSKVSAKNTGKKRSDETKLKMSIGIKNAYKIGKLKPGNGWKNVAIKQYKNIDYQGTYEIKFLEYVDKLGKLSLIDRGPIITYIINNVEHNYFSDFMIKGTNIVFEVKSSYYWKKNELVNIEKKKQAEKIYNYNLVMDNNFNKIKQFFI